MIWRGLERAFCEHEWVRFIKPITLKDAGKQCFKCGKQVMGDKE